MKNTIHLPAVLGLLLLTCTHLSAQKKGQALVDSLKMALSRLPYDTARVLTLGKLHRAWYMVNHDSAFPAAEEGLRLAEKLHYQRGIADLENDLGLVISDTGNNPLAREHFNKSLAINRALGDRIDIINNLVNIGRSYNFEADVPHATDYFFQALTIAEEIKNEDQIALVGTNLTATFLKQKNFKKALEYGEMTLEHARRANNVNHMLRAYTQLGLTRARLKDTLGGKTELDSAIALADRTGFKVAGVDALINRGLLESDVNERIGLWYRVEKSLAAINSGSKSEMINFGNLGEDYYELAKTTPDPPRKAALTDSARNYLRKAISMAETWHSADALTELLQVLEELEEKQGNYRLALDYHKRVTAINDSLFSQDSKNEIAGLEGKHDLALKDKELALERLTSTTQRRTSIGLALGVLLLVIIGVLLHRQSRQRKKLNTQLAEANQVKARFFAILSHDLRSPITNLLHFLHILREAPDLLTDQDRKQSQQEIGDSVETLLGNMESMLLWSKEQMESFHPTIRKLEVAALFDYLHQFFGAPEGIRLLFDGAYGLTLATDENYLRTIMQNLTSNALKVVRGRPDARVEWSSRRTEGFIVLSITDNGPGLSPGQAAALKADAAADNALTGFGFHLIRDLAKAIDCAVEAESEPGKGTVFHLRFKDTVLTS